MNRLDKQYQSLLFEVLIHGVQKKDRTGTGTRSVFGQQIKHDMSEGFPILTTKKVAFKTMVAELKWFLRGDTNIRYLVDNGCNIWNGDAYRAYLKNTQSHYIKGGDVADQKEFIECIKGDDDFAKEHGELGPVYGAGWRDWDGIDQINNLIEGIKNDPDSRRHIVSAWNVGELDKMSLPPCHLMFQCYVVDGELSLMWTQRSVDVGLGLSFNLASYGLLLLLLCEETGYKPGQLIGSLGDVHIYNNHIKPLKEQLNRDNVYDLPTIKLSNVDILAGEFDVELLNYECHPAIKMPLSVGL